MITLGKALGWVPLPLTVEEAQKFVQIGYKPTREDHLDTLPVSVDMHEKSNAPFIQVKDLQVSYGNTPALQGVDLNLYHGEIAVIMGPNGAGKSTLLRSIIGLMSFTKGMIRVGGKDVAGMSVADICQQVGYLPQDPNALLFADTVSEELLITLRNHHLDTSGTNAKSTSGSIRPGKQVQRIPP